MDGPTTHSDSQARCVLRTRGGRGIYLMYTLTEPLTHSLNFPHFTFSTNLAKRLNYHFIPTSSPLLLSPPPLLPLPMSGGAGAAASPSSHPTATVPLE